MAIIDKLNINGTSYDINDARNIFNLVYPVGSIYMSVNSTNPSTLFGGTWEQISQGRVLQGADTSHVGGDTIEAGLPNITGSLKGVAGAANAAYDWGFRPGTIGAFSVTQGNTTYNKYGGAYSATSGGTATFDASLSNSIYGNSTTVQPSAYVVYIWKRTA